MTSRSRSSSSSPSTAADPADPTGEAAKPTARNRRPPEPARNRRVLLLVESSRGYGRGCLQGIARYVRAHGGWTCVQIERSIDEGLPSWFPDWEPDGIIARVDSHASAESLARFKVPIVDLRGRRLMPGVPSLLPDSVAISRLAADHFLERGFNHLAFCGFPGMDFSDDREQAFVAAVQARSLQAWVYPAATASRGRPRRDLDTVRRETMEMLRDQALSDWLASLPKPVAVFACNDVRGRQVLTSCAALGLQVPEQVAVLGVDNDELICDFVAPGLSSIDPDVTRIGFDGAALLDRLMRGEPAGTIETAVPPSGVVTRVSTDILAIDDPIVREALALIRQHAYAGLNVEGLLDHLVISRTTLERRFARYLHRSPRDEIVRIRIQRTQQLLRETPHNLATIATMSGFKTAAHLTVVFKATCGITPGEYRARQQPGTAASRPGP